MTWILTNSGREHTYGPSANRQIDKPSLHEIAHSLAHINRFNGHALRAYSVAEHSLLVADLVTHVTDAPMAELCALMHDAHESVTGDMPTPIKSLLGGVWAYFEQQQQERMLDAYNLREPMRRYHSVIKRCDLIALATERRDLLPWRANSHTPWPAIDDPEHDILPTLEVDLNAHERTRAHPDSWSVCWLLRTQKLLETTKCTK